MCGTNVQVEMARWRGERSPVDDCWRDGDAEARRCGREVKCGAKARVEIRREQVRS